MSDILSPRNSGEYISKNSKFVSINESGISKLAEEIILNFKSGNITIEAYGEDGLHPTRDEKTLVDWMFLIDILNFCFWTPGDTTKWKVDQQTGYLALCAAVRRAVKEGIDITNPSYYSCINEEKLAYILRSDDGETVVPLLPVRVKCLHEVGKVLVDKYNGTFTNCIKEANKSAVKLLQIIIENFPCFRDESVLDGQRVSFYKRAQIAVADLWSRFLGQGLGEFFDIDSLTMFADYRVPQVLVHYGVLEYKPELMTVLKNDTILESGSREEIEIRGCCIHAVELVTNSARAKLLAEACDLANKPFNSVLVDYFLWTYRRAHAEELEYIPFHKVFGYFY